MSKETDVETFGLLALSALVIKIVGYVKAFRTDPNYMITQTVTWVVGILVLLLASNADLGRGIELYGRTLGEWDLASIVLAGLALGSFGSFAFDVKKAIDGTDTAAEPALIGQRHDIGCGLAANHKGVCRAKPATRRKTSAKAEAAGDDILRP